MNFMKGSLFHRSTEPEELEITQESGGGVLAVWGSPGCGKTVTVKALMRLFGNSAASIKEGSQILFHGQDIAQMKKTEGITEELKARDQLAWVGAMNSIRNRAEEIVRHELIYDAKEGL